VSTRARDLNTCRCLSFVRISGGQGLPRRLVDCCRSNQPHTPTTPPTPPALTLLVGTRATRGHYCPTPRMTCFQYCFKRMASAMCTTSTTCARVLSATGRLTATTSTAPSACGMPRDDEFYALVADCIQHLVWLYKSPAMAQSLKACLQLSKGERIFDIYHHPAMQALLSSGAPWSTDERAYSYLALTTGSSSASRNPSPCFGCRPSTSTRATAPSQASRCRP
jgi:hypothetical protein